MGERGKREEGESQAMGRSGRRGTQYLGEERGEQKAEEKGEGQTKSSGAKEEATVGHDGRREAKEDESHPYLSTCIHSTNVESHLLCSGTGPENPQIVLRAPDKSSQAGEAGGSEGQSRNRHSCSCGRAGGRGAAGREGRQGVDKHRVQQTVERQNVGVGRGCVCEAAVTAAASPLAGANVAAMLQSVSQQHAKEVHSSSP